MKHFWRCFLALAAWLPAVAAFAQFSPGTNCKNWPGAPIYGDNVHDDGPAIQAYLDFCYSQNLNAYFPKGVYLTRQTLILRDPDQTNPAVPAGGKLGWAVLGEGGPNATGGTNTTGVCLRLDNPSAPAVLEMGPFVGREMQMRNISLLVSGKGAGQTALLIPYTYWSRWHIEDCAFWGGDYGIRCPPNPVSANGEQLNVDDCTFQANVNLIWTESGEAYCWHIRDCSGGTRNGGSDFRLSSSGGFDFDVEGQMSTSERGPLPNYLLQIDGVVSTVSIRGGRMEHLSPLRYSGGSPDGEGVILFDHVHFAGIDPGAPLTDATRGGRGNEQYRFVFRDCQFNGSPVSGNPIPLVVKNYPSDRSIMEFTGCNFTSFTSLAPLLKSRSTVFGSGNRFLSGFRSKAGGIADPWMTPLPPHPASR